MIDTSNCKCRYKRHLWYNFNFKASQLVDGSLYIITVDISIYLSKYRVLCWITPRPRVSVPGPLSAAVLRVAAAPPQSGSRREAANTTQPLHSLHTVTLTLRWGPGYNHYSGEVLALLDIKCLILTCNRNKTVRIELFQWQTQTRSNNDFQFNERVATESDIEWKLNVCTT